MDQYNLVGKVYIFPDGVKLSVLQIKMREDELGQTVPVITFTTQQGKSLPKKQRISIWQGFEDGVFGIQSVGGWLQVTH